jgi:hypothetical protein
MEQLKPTQVEVSSQPSTGSLPPSRKRIELILRCQKALFSSYRADQYADAEGFMISLGTVLEQFPDEVIKYVCMSDTGIQRRMKWPPTVSEVVDACEEHREFLAKQRGPRPVFQERKPEPLLRDRPQGYMAQIFVPMGHHRYEALCKRAEDAAPIWWKYGNASDGRQGIWVSHNFWSNLPDVQGASNERPAAPAAPAPEWDQITEAYAAAPGRIAELADRLPKLRGEA